LFAYVLSFLFLAIYRVNHHIIINQAKQVRLSPRNIVSTITYTLAAALGGFCPAAAYIVVAIVTCWRSFPEKKKGTK